MHIYVKCPFQEMVGAAIMKWADGPVVKSPDDWTFPVVKNGQNASHEIHTASFLCILLCAISTLVDD